MTGAPVDPWTAAIHGSATDGQPLGAGVVIDHRLVLTCEHFLKREGGGLRDPIWVAFPKAHGAAAYERRRVSRCVHNGHTTKGIDLVLLELEQPVPSAVTPARLRCPPAADLVGKGWWSFGFPATALYGSAASGDIGHPLMYGNIYLNATSKDGVAGGFSGGPLWSPEYDAVVGIVVSTGDNGDGNALTLSHADDLLPEMKLSTLAQWGAESADEPALAAWGWVLSRDDEAPRHWLPRARGVASASERGSRFRGRTAALRRLASWLDRPEAAGRPLVVTGSPGVGKSAVLGRVVTTADREIQAALPPDDDAVRANVGSVSCAVHAKGKSALEVATEIARAAAVTLPTVPPELVPALRDRLTRRPRRFNLVIDALDEASSPEQARRLVHDVILPLSRGCADLGVQVAVGTRRADDHGPLLAEFGLDTDLVDLDSSQYFSQSDLAGYALATLQLLGAERPGNPYADHRAAAPLAHRIAAQANGNFLIAGLIARAHGLHDLVPADPERIALPGTLGDALDAYIARLQPAGETPARLALTALGYAETPGLPLDLWRTAVGALGGTATEAELAAFAQTSAANFLVETGSGDDRVYRLFHQALNEALLGRRVSPGEDEQRLVQAWLAHARSTGWAAAPEYLLRSLPQHAARSGLVDDLLTDDDYLLRAQLRRLLPAAEAAQSAAGRARAHLLQRTPSAVTAGPADRAAMFSVVNRLDQLDTGFQDRPDAPYHARWARTVPRFERSVLEGHSDAVYDVCAVPVDGRTLLASAGEDGTVRLWDPLTGQTERVLDCHADCINGIHSVRSATGLLLATGSHDKTIGLWDPRTGREVHRLRGHGDWVRNLCAVPLKDGTELLASAGDDRTVRLWNPGDGSLVRTLAGHTGWVTAVCHVPMDTNGLLASTGFDGTVRLWNPETGAERDTLRAHRGWATTLAAARTPRGTLLASAGYDGAVRVWDPLDGSFVWQHDPQAGPVTDLCVLHIDGGPVFAATSEDGVIRLWDAASGAHRRDLRGPASWIRANCELPIGDRRLLATAGDDGTVRLWDVATGRPEGGRDDGRLGSVAAVCAVSDEDGRLVASGGRDGSIRLWDAVTGDACGDMQSYGSGINGICAVVDEESVLLATAGDDNEVQLWDAEALELDKRMQDHYERVNAVCVLDVNGLTVVASAADDEVVRLWDPRQGAIVRVLLGHRNWVTALVAVPAGDRQLLASADKSGTLRLWDPQAAPPASLQWERQGHHDAVNALCTVRRGDRTVVASAGADRVIRLWDPRDGRPLAGLTGHTGPVTGVCPLRSDEGSLLVSTSQDRTVRLWDPMTGRTVRTIQVHHRALACDYLAGTLIIGLDQGLLALAL
ncbi:MAG: trypsin-like peptidase domain-containing protein [Micromonosporaceae bacterium]|nr:trypsin-like peptidase domain-containing protein [Micromonosporaceae bacterium]